MRPRYKILDRLSAYMIIIYVCLLIPWVIYILFGHQLISNMYEGRSIGLLNSIIESQDKLPLEHYLKLGDKITKTLFLVLSSPLYAGLLILTAVNKRKKNIPALAGLLCFTLILSLGYQIIIMLLPAISSYLFVSYIFKKINILDKLNILFLALTCQVILATEALSLFNGINGINLLAVTALFFGMSLFLGKGVTGSARADYAEAVSYIDRLRLLIKNEKLFALFSFIFLISIIWRIFLIIYVPPNNWDAMASQLSRTAYWLQNHSLGHYHTHFSPQTAYPVNAQILFLWTMTASKSDILCGFIQFICYLLSGTLIYRCLRQYLKVPVTASASVMLIWYCLPVPVLQSTSVQNDLVVAYFAMFGLTYFLLGIRKDLKYAALSAVALAIAIGTKYSIVFFLIPFLILAAGFLLMRRISLKRLICWGGILILSWAIFSSYNFIQNYLSFKNVFLPQSFIRDVVVPEPSAQTFFSNLFQHSFNIAVNQSGVQFYILKFSDWYNTFTAGIGERLFGLFNVPVNAGARNSYCGFGFDNMGTKFSLCEDIALFGSAGMIMLSLTAYVIGAFFLKLFLKRIRFDSRYMIFAYLFIGYLSAMSYLIGSGCWESRFMITAMLTGMPVLALIFNSRHLFFKKLSSIIIIYSIALLLPSTFMNERKPLTAFVGYNKYAKRLVSKINSKNRNELRYSARPAMLPIIRKLGSLVPLHSRVGILLPEDSWDYPIFGEGLERTVVPLDLEILRNQEFDFLLVVDTELAKKHHKELREFIIKNYAVKIELGEEILNGRPYRYILYAPAAEATAR